MDDKVKNVADMQLLQQMKWLTNYITELKKSMISAKGNQKDRLWATGSILTPILIGLVKIIENVLQESFSRTSLESPADFFSDIKEIQRQFNLFIASTTNK